MVLMGNDSDWATDDGGKGTHFRGGTTGLGDDMYLLLIYPYSGTHFYQFVQGVS